MKNIIPKDTRYIPLTQQKSCCVPTSISIVMLKLGIPLVSQELLGAHLGLIVDKKNEGLFWNAFTGEKPKSGYGTRMSDGRYAMNTAFKKLKIPLKGEYFSISNFKTKKDLVSFISDRIKKNGDIIACFNSGTLNNDNKKKGGHLAVVDRIFPKINIIRLIDPSPSQPKWREVSINKLKKAMELHPVDGGLWELKKVK